MNNFYSKYRKKIKLMDKGFLVNKNKQVLPRKRKSKNKN